MYVYKVKYKIELYIVLDTIYAKSIEEAIKTVKKQNPKCTILGIFDYYNC
jgi:hypothetical protein